MICKNCSSEFLDDFRFCPSCGSPSQLKRIDKNYFLDEISQLFNFEKGILFTIKALLTKPAGHIRTYITENRSRYVKPIAFLIITTLVYTLANKFLKFEKKELPEVKDDEGINLPNFTEILSENYEYFNVLFSFLTAFVVWLFFRRYAYNFFEVFVLQCYIVGMEMLLSLFFGVLQFIFKVDMFGYGLLVGFIYSFMVTAQFFDKTKFFNYIKAIVACIVAYVLIFAIIVVSIVLYYEFAH